MNKDDEGTSKSTSTTYNYSTASSYSYGNWDKKSDTGALANLALTSLA